MSDRVKVRLTLADGGDFLVQDVTVPASSLHGYERLVDALREDPAILKELWVDHERLVAAQILPGEA